MILNLPFFIKRIFKDMEIENALIQRGTGEIQSILYVFVTENYLN